MTKFLIGLVFGAGIAYLVYRAQALNRSGGIAAGILGTIVFGLGGVRWAAVLLTFFISSSVLSKVFKSRKTTSDHNFAKGSQRDAGQVAANGGTAGLLVLLYFYLLCLVPESQWGIILWVAFAGSLAGANADTWATELGILNPRQPVLLRTLKRVPLGTSGAVSLVGTLAALAGSALIGGMAVLGSLFSWESAVGLPLWMQFLLITISGFLGSFVDSYLGATVQAVYICPVCAMETEQHPQHICGTSTTLKRGMPWISNDWINLACTLSAGLTGLLLALIFRVN